MVYKHNILDLFVTFDRLQVVIKGYLLDLLVGTRGLHRSVSPPPLPRRKIVRT